jgi:protein tyrosine/serine phosphatase
MQFRASFLVVVLALAACSHGETPGAAAARAASGESGPVANFAQVAPGIFRGAQPDPDGFRALKERGVKTIVNLRSKHDDRVDAEPLGMSVVTIPMSAKLKLDPPDDDEIRTFLAAVTDPARQPVFVHCAEGRDRTGVMCAVYRMEVEGWTPERALEEMRSFGWHDETYREIGAFVAGYAKKGLVPAKSR